MLKLDLARLGREGSVRLDGRVPADDPLWSDDATPLAGPLQASLTASTAGSGEIVVRGRLSGPLLQPCRRCLEPVPGELVDEVTMVFVPASEEVGEDEDLQVFDPGAAELDLSDAVREEVILALNPYVVCDPECRGLCPRCGVNWNEETCACTDQESDPRWDALRALKTE